MMDTRHTFTASAIAAISWIATALALAAQPAPGDLARFRATLAGLDTRTPACLDAARQSLVQQFRPGHPDAEPALRAFREFYLSRVKEHASDLFEPGAQEFANRSWRVAPELDLRIPTPMRLVRPAEGPEAQRARRDNPALASKLDALLRWPFAVGQGEGDWYVHSDPGWLADAAKPIGGALGEYLEFLAAESRQVVAEDAGLQIPWDDLRRRIGRWDRFARTHAGLPETAREIRPAVAGLAGVFLCGIDNTPAYDRETLVLDSELGASYQRLLAEDRDSSLRGFVEGLVAVLKKDNFHRTPAVERYLGRPDSPAPCRFRAGR
jgi:hypothetical protein